MARLNWSEHQGPACTPPLPLLVIVPLVGHADVIHAVVFKYFPSMRPVLVAFVQFIPAHKAMEGKRVLYGQRPKKAPLPRSFIYCQAEARGAEATNRC